MVVIITVMFMITMMMMMMMMTTTKATTMIHSLQHWNKSIKLRRKWICIAALPELIGLTTQLGLHVKRLKVSLERSGYYSQCAIYYNVKCLCILSYCPLLVFFTILALICNNFSKSMYQVVLIKGIYWISLWYKSNLGYLEKRHTSKGLVEDVTELMFSRSE